jgi:hypothetical protein
MDEKLKQAFETANYMTSLADQKRILQEEYQQNSIYFHNGGCFHVTKELINFVKTLLDLGRVDAVLIDANNLPIDVTDLKKFFDEILDAHFTATNLYFNKYQKLKNSRTVERLINS